MAIEHKNLLKNINKLLFFLIVIIPLILISLYYLVIASDKYVSEAKITIKSTGESSAKLSFGPFTFGSSLAREDAYFLKEYIHSYDMLNYLEENLKIRTLYTNPKIDFWSRLDKDATQEEFFEYYKDQVKIIFDEISSVLTIKVKAFTPEDAKRINEAILEQCERYLNSVSNKIAREQMNFIEKELQSTNQRVNQAKQVLMKFQNTHKVLDPTQEAQAILATIAQLESQLVNKEAELKTLKTYLSENAFQVQVLKQQIVSLKEEIEKEKARLLGPGDTKLNRLMMEYLTLKLQTDFLTDVYKATLSSFENTRVEASRKIKTLMIIQAPNLPEEALYPKRGYMIFLSLILSLLTYGIAVLVVGIIKEHVS
ncbi:MAG: capsule biosynthesis protein [Elusimicrobiota bacterium]|nr:capsule biosynthesis protein [Endomicrobiia bacterium]MDW8165891.1 capsule biosynthesis protein [Elusimicrobiota bacterium]